MQLINGACSWEIDVKPTSLTFYELAYALRSLHHYNQSDLDNLHDVWLRGAPTPDSRILNANHYDPRKRQAGNLERRLILPQPLAAWIQDVATRNGYQVNPYTAYQAVAAIGRAFHNVSHGRKPLEKD